MDPLLLLSATRLADLIRRGDVTSADVVEAHIAHCERVNPVVNAIVRARFEEARQEARAADALLRDLGPKRMPPFHGVPCTIKECFALTGMPNSSGLVSRRALVSRADATAVARLRQAGAIPLGVTNTSELCMWMETNNRVYGRTNNPYDPARIAGGSSGGEGAIVGAGASPFGLGSDIGGSIRMPAFFNGVFGHKPTGGLVPGTGQFPMAENAALRYLATGPLARRAEDLMPLLHVLAGPDGADAGCVAQPLGDPTRVSLGDLTVLDVVDNGTTAVAPDLRAAQRAVADALAARGARVTPASFAALRSSFDIWSSSMAAANDTSFRDLLGNGAPVRPLRELLRWPFRGSQHTLPALVLALLERLPEWTPARARRFVEAGRALRAEVVQRLGSHGVLLYPSYPEPAPRHRRPLFPPFNWVYTAIFNVLELPVTQVPLGLNADGLPLGVQVVGAPGADHVTIAVALALEAAFGGWVPPGDATPVD